MPLTSKEKVLLANATRMTIQVHGLKEAQHNGARGLLNSLLNPEKQKESLKKCQPKDRELVEARFNALYENQEEALDLIESILNPNYKDSKG